MTTDGTSPKANVELLCSALQAFNAGDFDACVALITPDFIINLAELPEPMHGPDTWRQGAELIRRGIPNLRAHIEDIAGDLPHEVLTPSSPPAIPRRLPERPLPRQPGSAPGRPAWIAANRSAARSS